MSIMKNTQENLDLIMENYNQSATDEYYKNIDGDWEITYYDEGTEVENINTHKLKSIHMGTLFLNYIIYFGYNNKNN